MTLSLHPIVSNIFLIQGNNRGRFPYSHSILILTPHKQAIIIDTGCGLNILNELVTNYDVVQIINSHTHPDHSAGNWLFKDKVQSIIVPKEGFSTSGDILKLSERFTESGELAEYWQRMVSGNFMNFKNCKPTAFYDEETLFEIGDISLLPIHTPGHTIDHYCFYEPNLKILFAFDYDMTPFGPWYGHRESNISHFQRSIHKLQKLDIYILVSSHRDVIYNDIDMHFKQFLTKFDKRSEHIYQLVQNGFNDVAQLVDKAPIYKGYPYAEPLLRYWEEQMIKKHIIQLKTQGKLLDFVL